jgi:hypothetical protein
MKMLKMSYLPYNYHYIGFEYFYITLPLIFDILIFVNGTKISMEIDKQMK